jgi:hypothetical protein
MSRIGSVAAALALATSALSLPTTNAADAETAPAPLVLAQQFRTSPPGGADAKVMRTYKQATWRRYLSLAGGTSQAASDDDGPPPTDCPPDPPQVCLDSWKVKPVNPFE